MKKLLFAILLLTTSGAFAQGSEPTKEDAINFIKKVYQENFPKEDLYNFYFNRNIILIGCTLVITHDTKEKVSLLSHDTVSIDLSNVAIREYNAAMQGEGPVKCVIPLTPQAITIRGTWVGYMDGKNNNYYHSVWETFDPSTAITAGGNIKDWVINEQLFNENNYPERLLKAYEFLIKACGGGKLKVNPADKF